MNYCEQVAYLIRDVSECGCGQFSQGVEDGYHEGEGGVGWQEFEAYLSHLQNK